MSTPEPHGETCECFVCSPELWEAFNEFKPGDSEYDTVKMLGRHYEKYLHRICTIDKIVLPLDEHRKWMERTEDCVRWPS